MKRAILLLVLICPAVGLAETPPRNTPPVGTYACIAHRTVGLQDNESGGRYAGKIELPTEQKNFLIIISRRPITASCELVRKKIAEGKAFDWVFGPYKIFWECAMYELKFSKGKAPYGLRGTDTNVFRTLPLTDNFWIRADLAYSYQYITAGIKEDRSITNNYVEEGVCQKMEVPK